MHIVTLYLMAFFQGILFTIIPGASSFLTADHGFSLSSGQYGTLFLPMILGAIGCSFFGGSTANKLGIRNLSITSCILNIFAMICFGMSASFAFQAYWMLLITLFLIGASFGINLSTLNSYVLEFFPKRAGSAICFLYAVLGVGRTSGPLLFHFVQTNFYWWMVPLFLGGSYLLIATFCRLFFPENLNLPESTTPRLKRGVWLFLLIALLYGISETAFGNWGVLYLCEISSFSKEISAFALSGFWAALTLGRLAIALLSIWIPSQILYRIIGFILVGALCMLNWMQAPFISFVLAGLGCSAFLPLTISFAQRQDLAHAELISGLIIALYMCGYGISAYGVSFLPLKELYIWLLIPAAAITFLANCKRSA